MIKAPYEVLSKIESLSTESYNIQDAQNSIVSNVALSIPEGVTLINTPNEVMVNIEVEKLQDKTFTINGSEINLLNAIIDDSILYEINTVEAEITVRGKQSDLAGINLLNLKPRIDVSDLEEGTYLIPLEVDLPPNSRLITPYEVEVTISKADE